MELTELVKYICYGVGAGILGFSLGRFQKWLMYRKKYPKARWWHWLLGLGFGEESK